MTWTNDAAPKTGANKISYKKTELHNCVALGALLLVALMSNLLRAAPITDLELPAKRPGQLVQEPKIPDQWSGQEIAEGRQKCAAILIQSNAEFEILDPIRKGACGTAAPVKISALGAHIRVKISPPASLNCNMVGALHRWLENKVQPLAKEQFSAQVVEIKNISSYACRRRYNNPKKRLSEHALANALDIAGLKLSDGRYVNLLDHWGETKRDRQKLVAKAKAMAEARRREQALQAQAAQAQAAQAAQQTHDKNHAGTETGTGTGTGTGSGTGNKLIKVAKTEQNATRPDSIRDTTRNRTIQFKLPAKAPLDKRARFLRQIHVDACGIFGTVLGPEANQAHANHYHFDLAPRRRSAYCE